MAIQPGRVGVDQDQVDEFGQLVSDNVTFKDLTEFKIKLDTSLLMASNFSDFKNAMIEEQEEKDYGLFSFTDQKHC